ncbi:polysaccharide biosynthesis tyrosine autokinase [Burkholderia cepacia]|uniref:polysaccharide biosynthesis tyrosine autokinase n=1 Tax=Burkholderia cepacia TaxID=292 RepID=UPI0013F3ED84|nr:polysaccharide biosynthesis tyrosine autokinase [Burkholderia cepacia]NHB11130.1 polysaccharide biosynthesis tyrosine autokinase [Burkholderia cepacia]
MTERTSHVETFNFGALLDTFLTYRRMMAAIFAVCALSGVAWALLSAPVYQADILVQVEDNSTDSTARSTLGDLSSLFGVKASAETEKHVLGSRFVVARAVDRQRLFIDVQPVRFPLVGGAFARGSDVMDAPGTVGWGGYAWGAARIDVAAFDVPAGFEDARYVVEMRTDGHYGLSGPGLGAGVVGRMGERMRFGDAHAPIVLQVDAISARPGVRFELVRHARLDAIVQLQQALRIAEAGKDSNVLRVGLRGADPQRITATLNEIAGFYVEQNAARKAAEAARSLEFLERQLPQLRRTLDESETKLAALRIKLGSVDVIGDAQAILQAAADNETQRVQLRQKRAELLSRFTAEHEAVVALDRQIAVLSTQAGDIGRRIAQLPGRQSELVRLERDVKVNTELYVGLHDNIEQLKVLRASRIGNVRVLDLAEEPQRPIRYRRALGVVAACVLGVLFAMVAAYVRGLLFGAPSEPVEMEEATGLRVVAAVPLARRSRIRREVSVRPLASRDPGDPAIEALRSLRTSLQFAMQASGRNVVLVTGTTPGVGKSFISANLALVVASVGQRVLLVDGDLRCGRLDSIFGAARVGFADVLAGGAPVDSAIHATRYPNLDFMASGTHRHNAADLLGAGALATVMAELSSRYDMVVLDSAPLLLVTDATLLAPFAAGNVYVVARAGRTGSGEVQEVARRLRRVGVEPDGVIHNGIDPHAGRFRYGMKYATYRYDASRDGETALEPKERA